MGNPIAARLRGLARRIVDLMPTGGIGDTGPAPDADGRRDTDADDRAAVVRAKTQLSPGGMGTTTYEAVDRANTREAG